MELSTETVAVFSAVVTTIGALSTAFLMFWKSKTSVANDVIDTQDSRIEQLEGMVRELQAKVLVLEKQSQDKDMHIRGLESILQNRNPEMVSFMTTVLETVKSLKTHSVNNEERIKEILTHVTSLDSRK